MGSKIVKSFLIVFVLALAAWAGELWWKTVVVGGYLATANLFLSILAIAAPVFIVLVTVWACIAISRSSSSDLYC